MKKIVIVASVLIISGCTSLYSKYYTDNTRGVDITKQKNIIITDSEPEVRRGVNYDNDGRSMAENGYWMVGYSSFNASNVNDEGAISKAKDVHASVVILYSQYTGTQSGYMPLTVPSTNTSSTLLNGNIYGQGGAASYSGTSNTIYHGTNTTYIPFSVSKYDYGATYWIKNKPPILGILPKELTQEAHKRIGSNKGLLVDVVIKGSPAFYADIFSGDILEKINDDVIFDTDSLYKSNIKNANKEVDVLILRDDKEIHKLVKLHPLPA
jgi:PDZ domain